MSTTREKLTIEARSLIRKKGYSSFSFNDLERSIGIRKASIYHHFKSKEDLGIYLIKNCISNTKEIQLSINDKYKSALDRLIAYKNVMTDSLLSEGLPTCSALGAEMKILPDSLKNLTGYYFDLHLEWIESCIRSGIQSEELNDNYPLKTKAFNYLSLIQGACMINLARDCSTDISDDAISITIEKKFN